MDILFWSGGKDSFLALKLYQTKNATRHLKLLTTYDENSDRVPFQNLSLQTIEGQAEILGFELLLTPLPSSCPNEIYLEKVAEMLCLENAPIRSLIFGDWYLTDIRQWREQQMGELGFTCKFPIWKKPLSHLLNILSKESAEIRISAAAEEYQQWIHVGEVYDQHFVDRLPKGIDPMGEKGEFHTKVILSS